jgi:hypothetical protein
MDKNKYDRTSLTIYFISILAVLLTEFCFNDKTKAQETDIVSTAFGFITVLFFYFNAQRLLYFNQFFKYGLLGLVVLVICFIKQLLTGLHALPLFLAGLPFIFILYYRGLTFIFYKDYSSQIQKPIIVFASQYGSTSFDGKEEGYVPTMKEKIFSLLLFMGFIFFAFGLLMLTKVLFKFM